MSYRSLWNFTQLSLSSSSQKPALFSGLYKSLLIMFTANLYSLISFYSISKISFLLTLNLPEGVMFALVSMLLNMVLHLPVIFYLLLCLDISHSSFTTEWGNTFSRKTSLISIPFHFPFHVWVINKYLVFPWWLEGNHYQSVCCKILVLVLVFFHVSISPY